MKLLIDEADAIRSTLADSASAVEEPPPLLGAAAMAGTSDRPDWARVVVVDDHPIHAEQLARSLIPLDYTVATATSGREALARIAADPPDLVLLDVLMPDLSGLDVLRRLRALPATEDLPVILISGRDQAHDVVEGLKLGANDYVTKPINLPILQARLAIQRDLKRARDELKRFAQRQEAENQRHARDLQMAAQVQRSLLPSQPFRSEWLETAWCYEAATQNRISGDLFDVVPLSDDRLLLFIADAMGHGIQAALVAATVKATLMAHVREADDLSALMTTLDEAVGTLFEDRFVTAAAGIVNPRTRTLQFVGAGHPPVLVANGEVREVCAQGLPLGTSLGSQGEGLSTIEVPLEPGSAILFYTDGLTEAMGPSGRQFGTDALAERLDSCAHCEAEAIVQYLHASVDAFRGPLPMTDDLTMLVARLTP